MVTPREKQELERELERAGHVMRITGWPARTTYFKPTGEAMPGLPSDAVSMKRYLAKGFTLIPPPPGTEKPVRLIAGTAQSGNSTIAVADRLGEPAPAEPSAIKALTCSVCGAQAKSALGLYSHSKKHAKEKS